MKRTNRPATEPGFWTRGAQAWNAFWHRRQLKAIERRSGGQITFTDEPFPFLVDPVARVVDVAGSHGAGANQPRRSP